MLFCFVACLLCLGMGVMFTWPSATLTFFDSKSTHLHRQVSDIELVLFGCLPFLGAIISIPVAGICLDKLGRKNCAIISSSLSMLSWTMIVFSNRVEVVLLAIFISGSGGAMFLIAPIYISEISRDFIKGALTAGCIVLYELGMQVSYILGAYLDYQAMAYVSLFMSALGTFCIYTLKESPVFLIAKGMEDEAAKSIAFYRGSKPDTQEVIEEMNKIRRTFISEMDTSDITNKEETLESVQNPFGNLLKTLMIIKRSQSTRNALFVMIILVSASVFQGIIFVQAFAEEIFEEAIPDMPGLVCYNLMIIMSLIVAFIAAYLTELVGRRPLMIYSSFATGVVCILLGTQIHLNWGPSWLKAVLVFLFTLVYTFGAGTVPYAFIHEVFLPEVKCVVIVLVIQWLFLCVLIYIFIIFPFSLMDANIGRGSVYYLSAVDCFFTIVFCIFYLPETKGLSMDEIQGLFNKGKRVFPRNLIFS